METTAAARFERAPTRTDVRRQLVRTVSIVITLVIASAWFVFLRPSALGGPATYVIVSGSRMLPALESGDLVVAFDQETYGVGDVIVYRVPSADPGAGTQIVHRVIGRARGDGYIVRGDNRESQDYWRPSDEEVVGKMRLRLPGVGAALIYIRTTFGVALMAALTTALVALGVFAPDRPPASRKPVPPRPRPRGGRTTRVPVGPEPSVWTRGLIIDARAPATSNVKIASQATTGKGR